MSTIEELLQERWGEGLCPIVNGLIFDDGRVVLCEFKRARLDSLQAVDFKRVGVTTLEETLGGDDSYFTGVTQWCSAEISDTGKRVLCGEGGFGGDGFVALTRVDDDHLEWIAFFENSNPFVSVAYTDGYVLAESSYGDRWSFPVTHPEDATVEPIRVNGDKTE